MTDIEQNIRARADAEQMAELCGEQTERFWEVLATIAAERSGKALMLAPKAVAAGNAELQMSDEEAAQFERVIVPFGKFAGEPVGDVPISYWTFVTESDFNRQLVRYMRSRAYQRRQEEPDE
jgi:hypothetical protein